MQRYRCRLPRARSYPACWVFRAAKLKFSAPHVRQPTPNRHRRLRSSVDGGQVRLVPSPSPTGADLRSNRQSSVARGEESRPVKMSILLGYLASLILTFVVSAMTLTAFLSFTGANTHPRFQRLLSEHNFVVSNKRDDHLRAARGTKAKTVIADAASLRVVDLTKIGKRGE